MVAVAMEEPSVSLSRAAHGVFQTESYSEASWTSRSGRCVRISGARKNGAEHKAPTQHAQRRATPEAKVADAHQPRLLGNLRKIAEPAILKPKASSDTEPDAEPASCADSPVAQVSAESHGIGVDEKRHQEEVRSLTAQLMDAKEQAECLKANQEKEAEVQSLTAQLKDAREQAESLKANQEKQVADAAAERERRKEVEEKSAKLLLQCRSHEKTIFKIKKDKAKEHAKLEAEKADLQRKLRRHSNPGMAGAKSGMGNENLAAHTAGVECGPLKHCSAEEKAALRKKLLLKWHPDKQPSADHSSFATSVMQEMQNCAEWRD